MSDGQPQLQEQQSATVVDDPAQHGLTANETSGGDASHAEHGDPRLAHHFESPTQQREAAKLGMWLFLATEVLLFGGLFCLYALLRGIHPEIFSYGSRFLDRGWGTINTGVLIISSLMMAIAVWCAQTGHQRGLIVFLSLTLVCAVDFLGVKVIEYTHKFHDNLVWGLRYYEIPLPDGVAIATTDEVEQDEPVVVLDPGDAEKGRGLYRFTCAGCHGSNGQGLPNSGKPLNTSTFLAGLDDTALLKFITTGRPVSDPLNTTGIAMLPRGGNARLADQDVAHIVQYLRVLQERVVQPGAAPSTSTTAGGGAPIEVPIAEPFEIPFSFIEDAPDGPGGLSLAALDAIETGAPVEDHDTKTDPRIDPDRPENMHLFFGLYFLMTGLHGTHVLIGMAVIGWLLLRAIRGDFTSNYYTPVDLGGLYWHLVDVIWIFLFPLIYLIH